MRTARGSRGECGLTLLELVIASALLAILAAAAMPLYEVGMRREREIELRANLRMLHRAIDQFHKSYVASGGALSQGGGGMPGAVPGGGLPGTAPIGSPTGIGGSPGQPGFPGGAPGGPGGTLRPRPPVGTPGMGQVTEEVPLIDVSQFDPIDSKGYPPNLKMLLEGVAASGGSTDDGDKIKYLRRVPLDPMMPADQVDSSDPNFGWGVRAYQDDPPKEPTGGNGRCEWRTWGRQNVWQVYSKSTRKALDGTYYNCW